MSKLGIHVASGHRTGIGDIFDAGPACVVAIDQNVVAEVRQRAPQAVIAFRTQQPGGLDNPPGLLDAPIEAIPAMAVRWCEERWPIWQLNTDADTIIIVNNELDVSTLESASKLNAFCMACLTWLEQHGRKGGICSFSTGCPSDDGGLTLEQRWEPLLQAVQYAATGGHAIVLHAHAIDHGPLDETGEDIAYRHERTLRYFAQHNLYPRVLIGELSNGVGGVEPNRAAYMAQIEAWDQHVMASPWRDLVIGGALYGFNAAESLTPVAGDIAAWIRTHPTPTDPIDPPPPLERQYERVVHLLPPSVKIEQDLEHFDPRFLQVAHLAAANRESIVASADDAFINPPQCTKRTVYVYNVGEWGGKDYFEAWVNEWYPPVPTIVYRELA